MSGKIVLIRPRRYGDDRGWFMETYNRQKFQSFGVNYDFVQDNHSLSKSAGTIRGLHFQNPPFAQAKLVRCLRGRIFDVAIDIRKGSPTYGKWLGAELSAENACQLLIPVGFAHGFMTLEDDTEVAYKVSAVYSPTHDAGLIWNDENIAITWPLLPAIAPILSDKDRQQPRLRSFESQFRFEGQPMELIEVQ